MCGRYGLALSAEDLADLLEVDPEDLSDHRPRFNIAPTNRAPVALLDEAWRRRARRLRWGLVPFWAKDAAIGNRLINARAESAADKPAFRAAFRRRRCLVPSDGFYEWQKRGKDKQPYHLGREGGAGFCMAGLWERWDDPGREGPLETFTILTTDAAGVAAEVHDRMPVILPREAWAPWLDPGTAREALEALLRAPDVEGLVRWPVSTLVNSPANDAPALREPLRTLL